MTSRPASIKGTLRMEHERPRRITESEMVRCKAYLLELLENEIAVFQA
jgi:hypothetical protein